MRDDYKYEEAKCELKYIPAPKSGGTWTIFEKHRGKRVFNVPNDLSFCADNPEFVLKSDYDALKVELNKHKEYLEAVLMNSPDKSKYHYLAGTVLKMEK